MIQYTHHQLIATNSTHQQIRIDLDKWSLLGMGQGHIILKNNDPFDILFWKVLMICTHQIHSAPQQLQSLYFQIINNIPVIGKHLLQRQLMTLNKENEEKIKVYVSHKLQIKKNLPEKFMVFLAQNLNRSKDDWQYTFQFKPKTPLPDKYSRQFFGKLCNNLAINSDYLQQFLNNRPLQQKTRWFKKHALKGSKKHINPLTLFGILKDKPPSILSKINRMDTYSTVQKLQNSDIESLNQNIFNQIIKSSILSAILKIQLLFPGSNSTISSQFSLWNKQIEKQTLLAQISKNCKTILQLDQNQTFKVVQNLLSSSVISIDNNNAQVNGIQQMFRFLISWSWRDVSLFIQLKLNNQQTQVLDTRITIIDYELKQTSTVAKTIVKDEQFFINYLQYLHLIP